MGKRAKSKRHVEKMKARRAAKAQKAALYASQGGRSKRSQRRRKATQKNLRTADPYCVNIADINHHPDLNMSYLVRMKLLQLAGYSNQWTSRFSKQVRAYIDSTWSCIEDAWAAHDIMPA